LRDGDFDNKYLLFRNFKKYSFDALSNSDLSPAETIKGWKDFTLRFFVELFDLGDVSCDLAGHVLAADLVQRRFYLVHLYTD